MRWWRRSYDWTQQDLALRLKAEGLLLDRSQIAKLETGRRTLTLDEAYAIAMTLNRGLESLCEQGFGE